MSNPNTDFFIPSKNIHKGGWTNWNGNVKTGGKITISKDNADLLMIFIGIFFVFAEAGLWSLISFGLFLWRRWLNLETTSNPPPGNPSTSNPPTIKNAHRDALWNQQQAVLRNAGDDRTVGLTYLSLLFVHGAKDPKIWWRTMPTVFLALGSFGIFLVALPFVAAYSMLDNQANEVLINNDNCGWWYSSFENDLVVASTDTTNRTREALQYAEMCYESDADAELCDNFLMQRKLQWTTWHTAECPFDDDVCLSKEKYPAFQLESYIINSHIDLGLNSPKSGRFSLKHTVTCAPLDVAAYSTVEDGLVDGENVTEVNFGETSATLYTFAVSNLQYLGTPGYNLISFTNYPSNESVGTFTPIKELDRSDADVSVILLNNNMIPVAGTNGACHDPFFSASERESKLYKGWFFPDNPITAIGCADQYAFYDPVTQQESNMTGMLKLGLDMKPEEWKLSERQFGARSSLLWAIGQIGSTGRLMEIIGYEALRAPKYPGVFNYYQNPIPDDQWKNEVSHWFSIRLAALQLQFIRIAMGPPDPSAFTNAMPGSSSDAGHDFKSVVCNSQKIHDNGYKNFHRGGFIAIAVLGSLLIILPFFLIKGVLFWGRHWEKKFILDWISYGHLQLLRMANEGAEVKGWQGYDREIPRTDIPKVDIARLDVGNDSNGALHPTFVKPSVNIALVQLTSPTTNAAPQPSQQPVGEISGGDGIQNVQHVNANDSHSSTVQYSPNGGFVSPSIATGITPTMSPAITPAIPSGISPTITPANTPAATPAIPPASPSAVQVPWTGQQTYGGN